MKEIRRNLVGSLNIKEGLLEITRDFSSQFQPHEQILKNITMFTTFLILAPHIRLWLIKLYAAFIKRRLMIIMFTFLHCWKLWLEACPFKPVCQILIPLTTILLTTIAMQIYWEWISCVSTKNSNWKEIIEQSWPFLNWFHELNPKYLIKIDC